MRLIAYMRFLCHVYTQKNEFCEYKMFWKFSNGLKCWICAIAEYGQRSNDKKGKILRPRSIFQRWAAAAVKLVPSFLLLVHLQLAWDGPHVNSCQHSITNQLGKGRLAFASWFQFLVPKIISFSHETSCVLSSIITIYTLSGKFSSWTQIPK